MAAAEPVTRVVDLRIEGDRHATRVVVESNESLKYNVFSLSAGSDRIVIDLPKIRWSIRGLTSETGSGAGEGLVKGYRYAHNSTSSSRLVLDLAGPAAVSRDFALSPDGKGSGGAAGVYRIVLDLKPTSQPEFEKIVAADLRQPRTEATRRARKPLIVIDPGHGGKDPGTISPSSGRQEKDLTLKVSQELKSALEATGRYEVALTRSADVFIELEDRVTKARDLGADLFISLHADAGGRPTVRGASVYTLSPEGEKRVEKARMKNDWVLPIERDPSRPREVNQVLADLVQRETKNQSARFAQVLVPHLHDAGWPILENTHRRRGFYVLLSPDVPAVLIEMGFLSNAEDEKMMASSRQSRQLAGGIVSAVDEFFGARGQALAQK
ncbi:MAG: N-acetylmuramoyl-L-alanine amidase [Hyphomonadaceae bacterium]